jgi:hypothetical protein
MKTTAVSLLIAAILTVGLTAEAKSGKRKQARSEAKKACLAEKPELKGRELKKCIKEKRAQRS